MILPLVLLFSSAAAWAQLDPKAQPYLDAYLSAFAQYQPAEVKAVDMTMCFDSVGESAVPEVCTRSVMDFSRRWMMSSMAGEYGFKMVYRGGRAQMHMAGLGESVPMPKTMVTKLEQGLEQMFEQISGKAFTSDFDSSHYDGFVRYGKVLQGVQVRATMTLPSFNPVEPMDPKPISVRLIFDTKKTMIGMVTRTPQGLVLCVPTSPESKNLYTRFMNSAFYDLKGKQPTLTGKVRVTRFKLNAPFEEKLFTLTPAR